MDRQITTTFDTDINAFIVVMPGYITLKELQRWKKAFLKSLCERGGDEKCALLMDTNMHQFESIECLSLLRNLLSNEPQVTDPISTVAFVQPAQYRTPGIVSQQEACFSHFEEARNWLRQKLR